MNDAYINYIDQLLDLAEKNDIFNLTSREFNEFSAEVLEALAKQKPMKPLVINGECTCLMCEVTIAEKDEYCWKCGQKLDWSEE